MSVTFTFTLTDADVATLNEMQAKFVQGDGVTPKFATRQDFYNTYFAGPVNNAQNVVAGMPQPRIAITPLNGTISRDDSAL